MAKARRAAAEPAWLTPAERETWIKLLALVTRLPAALDAQLQRDADLTFFEYSVLAVLSEQPGRTMRMSGLAFLSRGSASRLSHVATKLEQAGLLRRERDAEDGRQMNATITTAGMRRIRSAAPAHVAAARELVMDALTAEQHRALREVADQVLSRIDPDHEWPSLS